MPEEPGCDAAPGPPPFGLISKLHRGPTVAVAEVAAGRDHQRQVVGGHDIGPPERKQQIDFRAPPPDTFERDQCGDCVVVGHAPHRVQVHRGGIDRLGEAAAVGNLLAAQAVAA